jgi:hypothetical protein
VDRCIHRPRCGHSYDGRDRWDRSATSRSSATSASKGEIVAEPSDTVDLRTLEEVHRLLAASDFATEGDR